MREGRLPPEHPFPARNGASANVAVPRTLTIMVNEHGPARLYWLEAQCSIRS